ncbi:MAG: hypothetical protein M1163_05765 [Candidatus Thermoplasmatota archaeon]|nr:hypothetical protein [Candidatus Thermoplasmatota archaeon]
MPPELGTIIEFVNLTAGILSLLIPLLLTKKPSRRKKRKIEDKVNPTIGDLLREGPKGFKTSFLISYLAPVIAILIIDFLLVGLVFKELLFGFPIHILVGLALYPSRKIWQLLLMLFPYFFIFWALNMFPEFMIELILVPVLAFIIYAIFQLYILKNPNIPPILLGIRWVAPVVGLSVWRFQLTYILIGTIFIFLPTSLPVSVLLFLFVIVILMWATLPAIVVINGLRKARDLTLPFIGIIVKK